MGKTGVLCFSFNLCLFCDSFFIMNMYCLWKKLNLITTRKMLVAPLYINSNYLENILSKYSSYNNNTKQKISSNTHMARNTSYLYHLTSQHHFAQWTTPFLEPSYFLISVRTDSCVLFPTFLALPSQS